MTRTNLILIVVALMCAVLVVASMHESRKLFMELEREQDRMRQLEVEWGQLQLEQSTWAAHARVEEIAREKLRMVPPDQRNVVVVQAQASHPQKK